MKPWYLYTLLMTFIFGGIPLFPFYNEIHPTFPLIDFNGNQVIKTQKPLSFSKTCGKCHDTTYIFNNTYHLIKDINGNSTSSAQDSQVLSKSMNCFLCHLENADIVKYQSVLKSVDSYWADSLTLFSSGAIQVNNNIYSWNPEVFEENGALKSGKIKLSGPSSKNCGSCHRFEFSGNSPITPYEISTDNELLLRTGAIFSPRIISESDLNLKNKNKLSRSFDVHAERLVKCANCHFSTNNPSYMQKNPAKAPLHLKFDARKPLLNEYIKRPGHFFNGETSIKNFKIFNEMDSENMCTECHDQNKIHDWLPYRKNHMQKLSCQACHIPFIHFTAALMKDSTFVDKNGKSIIYKRGVQDSDKRYPHYIEGYKPILLPVRTTDQSIKLFPFNIMADYYWFDDETHKKIAPEVINTVLFDEKNYSREIINLFDKNKNSTLEKEEVRIDSEEKELFIKKSLERLGFKKPQIKGKLEYFPVSHSIAPKKFARRDCLQCHEKNGSINEPFLVAEYLPANQLPDRNKLSHAMVFEKISEKKTLGIFIKPDYTSAKLYLAGNNPNTLFDKLGLLLLVLSILTAIIHGSLRILSAKKRQK